MRSSFLVNLPLPRTGKTEAGKCAWRQGLRNEDYDEEDDLEDEEEDGPDNPEEGNEEDEEEEEEWQVRDAPPMP